jgi:hypothetical protein
MQRIDNAACVVHGQRGLRDVCNRLVHRQRERGDFGFALYQYHGAGNLADRAFHFRMPRVSNQYQRAALCDILPALHVNLGDERAGCIENIQAARLRVRFHRLRDAVCAENGDGAVRHFIEFLDETRTLATQIVDNMPIVDDLMAHVDGRAMSF